MVDSAAIYQFIERKYDELEEKDGGYYPSKHDNHVFKKASERFSISLEKVERKYNEYKKVEDEILLKRIDKYPSALRKKKQKELAVEIIRSNKDLPWSSNSDKTTSLQSGLSTIRDEYIDIVEEAGENGWSIPMNLKLLKLEELKEKDKNIRNFDHFFVEYYNSKKFNLLVKHVNKSNISLNHRELFNQCVDAYREDKYLICINGLIPILEGELSRFCDNKKNIRMMKVCKENMEATENDNKLISHLIWASCYKLISKLYQKSDFDGDEPIALNRHWILHGRSNTLRGKEDCLRLFNAIYTIISVERYI